MTSNATMQDWNALSDEDFRRHIRHFFETHYPAHLRYPTHRLRLAEVRDWYDTLSRYGWIAPAWPREYGGAGLNPAKLLIFIEEQEAYGVGRVPDHGIVMVGPLLMQQGTDEQKRRYLPEILAGREIWCQGYSEPNAGSDLASLRTEAVLDGDHFVVNGQKTWSTLAQDGTHMFMLVRTDKDARKQQGISFLLVDMKSAGITVRPMRTLSGEEEFCEVFFDNVRVPKDQLVGAMNAGWGVAKDLLGFERLFFGSPKFAQSALARLDVLGGLTGLADDAVFRDRFYRLKLDTADLASLYRRATERTRRGEKLGAEVSLLKIWATETYQRITEAMVEVAGPAAMIEGESEIGGSSFDALGAFFNARAPTIFGGTNEIQRNIVAATVLGLPSA